MDSTDRAEYTVIGNAINLVSRICSAVREDKVYISPQRYRQAVDYLEVKEI